jgi:hypothetical protein
MDDYIDISRCFRTGRDSVDDPLEEAEFDGWVTKRSLTLTWITRIGNTGVFLNRENIFDPVRRCRSDWYKPSDYATLSSALTSDQETTYTWSQNQKLKKGLARCVHPP